MTILHYPTAMFISSAVCMWSYFSCALSRCSIIGLKVQVAKATHKSLQDYLSQDYLRLTQVLSGLSTAYELFI